MQNPCDRLRNCELEWLHSPACLGGSDPTEAASEADIRAALHSRLLGAHATDSDTVIIDELGLCRGRVRVDVAVVNGLLHGYEIKSERDSLRRLSTQIEFYGRVLDRATLVVGERHLAKTFKRVPPWWGILRVQACRKGLRFTRIRAGTKNPCRDPRSLVELLWLDSAMALLERCGAAKGTRGKPRRVVWDEVCRQLSENVIAKQVREDLKARAGIRYPRQP